jgi:hypothetical protein
MLVILATWEVKIRKATGLGQFGQKVSEIPISTNSWAQQHALVIPRYARLRLGGQQF